MVRSSNIGSTILLRGEEEDHVVSLSWTPYVEFPGGLEGYKLSRRIDDEFLEIAELGPGTTSFSENITSIMNGPQNGEIQYRITAIGGSNPYFDHGESHSNILTISLETVLFMPNAFTPNGDGNNDYFIPILDFSPESFVMIIYDRAGRRLFETTDPYEGWDGSFRGGDRVMEGVYVYHVKYKEFTGSTKTLTGSVTVIYP
jgi:gliding motility-associated-like protein